MSFEAEYFDETTCNLFSMILNKYCREIAMQFEEGKAYLIEESQRIEEILKKSAIMNSYILFGLLKQMSKWGLNKIK